MLHLWLQRYADEIPSKFVGEKKRSATQSTLSFSKVGLEWVKTNEHSRSCLFGSSSEHLLGHLGELKTSLASMLCNLEAIWINTKLFDQTFLYLLSREQRLVRKRQGCPS